MVKSDKNIFDHGESSQHKIILPFMGRINEKFNKDGLNDDFEIFFISQMEVCFSAVLEYENRPTWVKDIQDYRMKSEISIFLSFLSAIDFSEKISHDERDIVSKIYENVKKIGEDRNWDLKILHIQFMKFMGFRLHNPVLNILIPQILNKIDFN